MEAGRAVTKQQTAFNVEISVLSCHMKAMQEKTHTSLHTHVIARQHLDLEVKYVI